MKRSAFSPHEGIYIQHLQTVKKHDMPVQHYHDAYEIYLLLDGRRYMFYDNICYMLGRGDMVIFRPFDIHYSESRDADLYERYVLNFQPEALSCILTDAELYMLEEKINTGVVHLFEEDTKEVYGYFTRADRMTDKKGFLSQKLTASAVLQLIIKAISYSNEKYSLKGEKISPNVIAAIKYINGHYKESLSLDDISDVSGMSKYYFSRLFRETTGATVFEYLNNVRLTRVHNLLISTKLTLEEIARETGFTSAITLARSFKNIYGISPRALRKEHK